MFVAFLFGALIMTSMTSCYRVAPDADEEAVLIQKPWFFGHGGVIDQPVSAGLSWAWWTTNAEYFKITPQRYDEKFDDIFSNDNTPLDFNSYINIQILEGKSPILLKNYGVDWYKNNIQVPYRNYTREEVSKYSPFDLISNREILNRIDSIVMSKMNLLLVELSKEKEFPVGIRSVVTGAASPNEGQKEEMNKTAQMIQAKATQNREEEMHKAREQAEIARAKADRAYMDAMKLTSEQFIQLKQIEMISSKDDAHLNVIIGADAVPMFNVH